MYKLFYRSFYMESKMSDFKIKLVELLKTVPDGERIHISKEVLEDLIFTSVVFRKNRAGRCSFKLPIWTGPFLQKIDLSELDFDDVAWSMLVADYDEVDSSLVDEDVYDKLMSDFYVPSGYVVDFSNTNANIDFSASFESKECGHIIIANCDFSNVNLADVKDRIVARDCNFSGTGLDYPIKSLFRNCDLSGNNLSGLVLDAIDLIGNHSATVGFKDCRLADTGISVIFDLESVSDLSIVEQQNFQNDFDAYLKSGCLDNCYVNQKKILSQKFQGDLLTDISNQISSFKK